MRVAEGGDGSYIEGHRGRRGKGVEYRWLAWNTPEKIEAAVNAVLRFPKLREEMNQYAEEVVLYPGPYR